VLSGTGTVPGTGTGGGTTTGGGTGTGTGTTGNGGGTVVQPIIPLIAPNPVVNPVPVAVAPSAPASVSDDFNRADAFKLGKRWIHKTASGDSSTLWVKSRQAASVSGGSTSSTYFNVVDGAVQSAGFTFAGKPVNGTALYLKATGKVGAKSQQMANAIRVLYSTAGTVSVSITTNGNSNNPVYTDLGVVSTGGQLANGDSLLATVDSTGKVWLWKVVNGATTLLTPSGVQLPNIALWTTGGGKVGMRLPNGAKVDNFVR
jgi:hypothetical protein